MKITFYLQQINSFSGINCTAFIFKLGGCTQFRLFDLINFPDSLSHEPNQLNEQSHIRELEFKNSSRSCGIDANAFSSIDATALFDRSNKVRLVRPKNAFLVICEILLPAK